MERYENFIKSLMKKNDYIEIDDINDLKDIYLLFRDDFEIKNNNSPLVNYYYGYYYQYINHNKEKSIQYYQNAANNNIMEAIIKLANIFEIDNKQKAYEYYQLAILSNNNRAFFEQAKFFYRQKEYHKFEEICKKAADDNYLPAMIYLGRYYKNSSQKNKMLHYLELAIKYHDSRAMHILGQYYQYDEIIPDKMTELYISAITHGNSNAMYDYSRYLFDKNKTESLKFLKMAALSGNKNALNIFSFPQIRDDCTDEELGKIYLIIAKKHLGQGVWLDQAKLLNIINNLQKKNNLLSEKIFDIQLSILEEKFKPNGEGYHIAKAHFLELSRNNNSKK